MNKFSRSVHIAILACLLVMGILYAKTPTSAVASKPKVLIEGIMIEVSSDALDKLQIARNVEPSSKVTVPLATLLYVLADPNAVKTVFSPKLLAYTGQTAKIATGEKLKYLVRKDDGSLEQKTTDRAIETTLEATPVIDKDGDILLNFKFEHFSVAPAKEIDPQTSLPIGEPMFGSRTVNTRLKLKPGEPMIAGGIEKPGGQEFILVRATILEQPAGTE